MRNPMQTECGHLFCKECLDPLLNQQTPLCPLDKETISRDGVSVYNMYSVMHGVHTHVHTQSKEGLYYIIHVFCDGEHVSTPMYIPSQRKGCII